MAVPKVESRGEGENLSERERETETETEEGVGSLHATVSTGAKELFRGNYFGAARDELLLPFSANSGWLRASQREPKMPLSPCANLIPTCRGARN